VVGEGIPPPCAAVASVPVERRQERPDGRRPERPLGAARAASAVQPGERRRQEARRQGAQPKGWRRRGARLGGGVLSRRRERLRGAGAGGIRERALDCGVLPRRPGAVSSGSRCGRRLDGGVRERRRRGKTRAASGSVVYLYLLRRCPAVASGSSEVAGPPLSSRCLLWPHFSRPPDSALPPRMRFLLLFSFSARVTHRPALHCLRALSPLFRGAFYLPFYIFFFGAPSLRPCTSPSRSILILSSFAFVGGVPIFPGSRNSSVPNHEVVSVHRPIGAEPAFPARGMLAHSPHAFAGGRFPPSLRPPVRLFPPGGGGCRIPSPPYVTQFTGGRCDVRGAVSLAAARQLHDGPPGNSSATRAFRWVYDLHHKLNFIYKFDLTIQRLV
jgi:hypothetical protein